MIWALRYRSSSAFKGHNMRCSFEIFFRNGGRNRRLLLASRNCYFLCRGDNSGIEARRYVSTLRSYMCLKCLISNVSFSLALFSPQIFFFRYIDMCMKDTDLLTENNAQPILVFQKKVDGKQMWNPPPLTCCC